MALLLQAEEGINDAASSDGKHGTGVVFFGSEERGMSVTFFRSEEGNYDHHLFQTEESGTITFFEFEKVVSLLLQFEEEVVVVRREGVAGIGKIRGSGCKWGDVRKKPTTRGKNKASKSVKKLCK